MKRASLLFVSVIGFTCWGSCSSKKQNESSPQATPDPPPTKSEPPVPVDAMRKKPATKLDALKYKAELARGRALAAAGKHADAMVAFESALKGMPNEPAALGELGWAAFNKGDLDRAKIWTNKAIALTRNRLIRAAALYNLGRILEKKKDKPGAIAAYRSSLALRPNAIVHLRLSKLGAPVKKGNSCLW